MKSGFTSQLIQQHSARRDQSFDAIDRRAACAKESSFAQNTEAARRTNQAARDPFVDLLIGRTGRAFETNNHGPTSPFALELKRKQTVFIAKRKRGKGFRKFRR